MSRGRLRMGVWLCWLSGAACQGPEKVYFEVPAATGGDAAGPAASSGGASSTGGSAGEPPAALASGGTPPLANTGGAAASTGGAPTAASAGQAGGGGAASVAADPAKQAAACADYVIAQCHLLSRCKGARYDQCLLSALSYCPARFFLPGSRISVESVERCAEQWRNLNCEDLGAERYPECEFEAGERALGEACKFSTQCNRGLCANASIETCSRCVPVAGRGEACSADVAICGEGLACLETGVCGDYVAAPAPGIGAACSVTSGCEAGLMCFADDSGVRTCRAKIAIGDPCGVTSECLDGFCDDDTKICRVVPELGMPCALQGRHPERSCAGGSVCDAHVDPPVCVTAVGRGQPCWVNPKQSNGSTCEVGLSCQCTDATCATRQCQQLVGPGEDCSFAAFCVEGSECRGGRCGPKPAQVGDTADCGT